jgi:LacI family transcriptional regulator, repressor for deo operon, udp, cdd, tsx, nupC, and nupG
VSPAPSPRNGKHASIFDVAALAGVSISTVSRVLGDKAKVHPDTRERVLEAVRTLRYVMSPHASVLASGRTRTIGMITPSLTGWYFANVIGGAYDVLHGSGYDIQLHNLAGPDARTRFFDRMSIDRRVDAVISVGLPDDQGLVTALRALGLPLVVLGARAPGASSVAIDDVKAARTAVRYLIHQGHRNIVMLSDGGDGGGWTTATNSRRRGYQEALAEVADRSPQHRVVQAEPGFDGGVRAVAELLAGHDRPSAIFAEYDELAIGALRALRSAGIGVPEQVSVIGLDDHLMAGAVDLTTVARPVAEEGALAARLVLGLLADGAREPVDVTVPTRLVIRGSTNPPHRPAGSEATGTVAVPCFTPGPLGIPTA